MSKGGRLSRFLPKFLRGENKAKSGQDAQSFKGPSCLIIFLDDSEQTISYKSNWKGNVLFDMICEMVNLQEKDYFGLRFVDDSGQTHWLDTSKTLSAQIKGCSPPHKFYFGVKFYAADPCKLHEEITRYLFFQQVKRDILQGRLPVSFEEAAELCAYAVQSELGDFEPRTHTAGYVSEFCFVPNQSEELEAQIARIHRRCVGATPVMAEHRFLERVKWLEMYGVDLHPVQGESNVEYFLGLTPTGVVVYKHKNKVASYFWPRLIKASHKGKIFTIKVKDRNNEEHVYAFELSAKPACKHLWKCCVEHHAFFSGRSERLAAANEKRSQQHASVRRAPSRRQARRVNSDSRLNTDHLYQEPYSQGSRGTITMMGQPEPVRAPRHRSLPELLGRQSPRSVKSAPWESKFDYGLYTSGHESPTGHSDRREGRHTSFVSGSDSESGVSHRKRYFPSRKGSDNESDASTSRRRRREVDSDSGSEVSFTNSGNGRKKRNMQLSKNSKRSESHILYPFHDKENNPQGSIPSLHSAPAGEMKQRRRRRRSKSPGNTRKPPEELKQHIEFDLVDTEGMTADQLRDIAYTKVETKASLFRVKYSPKVRQKIWDSRRKSFGDVDKVSKPSQRDLKGTNLSRQDSHNTDPVGGYYSANKRPGNGSFVPNDFRQNHQEPNQHLSGQEMASISPGQQQNGYNSSSSRAYLNPVYLNHEDARQSSNAGGSKRPAMSKSHSDYEHIPPSNSSSRQKRYDQSRLSYHEQIGLNQNEHNRQPSLSDYSHKQNQYNNERYNQPDSNQAPLRQQNFNSGGVQSDYRTLNNSTTRNSYNPAYGQTYNASLSRPPPSHREPPPYHQAKGNSQLHQTPPPRYKDSVSVGYGGNSNSPRSNVSTPPRPSLSSTLPRTSVTTPSRPPMTIQGSTRTPPQRPGSQYYEDQTLPPVSYSGSSSGYGGSQNQPNGSFHTSPHSQGRMTNYNSYNHQYNDRHGSHFSHNAPGPQVATNQNVNNNPNSMACNRRQYSSTHRSDLVTQL